MGDGGEISGLVLKHWGARPGEPFGSTPTPAPTASASLLSSWYEAPSSASAAFEDAAPTIGGRGRTAKVRSPRPPQRVFFIPSDPDKCLYLRRDRLARRCQPVGAGHARPCPGALPYYYALDHTHTCTRAGMHAAGREG